MLAFTVLAGMAQKKERYFIANYDYVTYNGCTARGTQSIITRNGSSPTYDEVLKSFKKWANVRRVKNFNITYLSEYTDKRKLILKPQKYKCPTFDTIKFVLAQDPDTGAFLKPAFSQVIDSAFRFEKNARVLSQFIPKLSVDTSILLKSSVGGGYVRFNNTQRVLRIPYPDTSRCYFLEISPDNRRFNWRYGYVVLDNGRVSAGNFTWMGESHRQAIGPFKNTFLYDDKTVVKNKVLQLSIVESGK